MNNLPLALLEAAAVEPMGTHHYRAEIADDYTVFGNPNGGYLQCLMANAALAAASDAGAPHVHVTAISTNFIKGPTVGPVTLSTRVRRVGRSASFVMVSLTQGDEVFTESVVTLGTLSEWTAPKYQSTGISIASLDECVALAPIDGYRLHAAIDVRYDAENGRWWEGERTERGEIRAWMRLTDDSAHWNAWSVLFASDALLPATVPLGSTGWVPTLQLTSYVHRMPSSEWLRARQWISGIADGIAHEHCELFDDRGELVASSTQAALVRFQQGD